jgi:hypothetical protein
MIPSPEGVLVDISGNGYDGDITNAPSTVDGMDFKGDNGSRVYLHPSEIITTPDCTIAARIRWNGKIAMNTDQVIFSNHNTTGLDTIIDSVGIRDGISWNYDPPGLYRGRADFDFIKGEWVDFVLSISNGRINRIFINGVEYSVTTSGFFRSGAGSGIGDRNTNLAGSSQPFGGEIADLRLFNYAFSEQEAIDYHNSFQKLTKRSVFSDHPVGSTI